MNPSSVDILSMVIPIGNVITTILFLFLANFYLKKKSPINWKQGILLCMLIGVFGLLYYLVSRDPHPEEKASTDSYNPQHDYSHYLRAGNTLRL